MAKAKVAGKVDPRWKKPKRGFMAANTEVAPAKTSETAKPIAKAVEETLANEAK